MYCKEKQGKFSYVNIRSVHAAQGIENSRLSQMCASMDLPQPATFKSYNSILQHVSGNAVEMGEQIMHEAAVQKKKTVHGKVGVTVVNLILSLFCL